MSQIEFKVGKNKVEICGKGTLSHSVYCTSEALARINSAIKRESRLNAVVIIQQVVFMHEPPKRILKSLNHAEKAHGIKYTVPADNEITIAAAIEIYAALESKMQ